MSSKRPISERSAKTLGHVLDSALRRLAPRTPTQILMAEAQAQPSGFLTADQAAECRKALGVRIPEDDARDLAKAGPTSDAPTFVMTQVVPMDASDLIDYLNDGGVS